MKRRNTRRIRVRETITPVDRAELALTRAKQVEDNAKAARKLAKAELDAARKLAKEA